MARGRRLLWATIAFIVFAPLVVLVLADWRLSSALGRIDGAFDGLDDRPPGASDGSVTMLMLATGDGTANSPTLSWMPGEPTVVSAMFVTITGDRRRAYVDWLPLRDDVLVGVADDRPGAAVAAAESSTGRRVDHLAVIEWSTFSGLGHDNAVSLHVMPEAGRRIQQEFLRRVLENTLHSEMRKEPWMLYRALRTVAGGMAVEESWSTYDMNRLAFSLRNLRSHDIIIGTLGDRAGHHHHF